MSARLLCVLLFLSVLSACSTVNLDAHSYPLSLPLKGSPFPANSEVLAMIDVTSEHDAQQLLLAVGTGTSEVDLALLTPHGLPIARLEYRSGRWHWARMGPTESQLQPQVLLAYLALIYFDDHAIAQRLLPVWSFRPSAGERLFTQGEQGHQALNNIRLRYEGQAPWYEAVSLRDGARGVRLNIKILEYTHVLPE